MGKKDTFSKILAVIGTVLVWLPLVAMVVFGLIALFGMGQFRVDYMIPAEVFPVELAGGLLLLWAALRTGLRRGWIIGGLVAAVVLIFGGQGLALITGLATNPDHPGGWALILVMGSLILFDLALAAVGVGGVLLLVDLFRRK